MKHFRAICVCGLLVCALSPYAGAGLGFSDPAALVENAQGDTVADGGPRLEYSATGTWIASWPRGAAEGENDVVVSRSVDAGTTWSAPVALNADPDTDTVSDINPRLATDGAGNWVAIWVRVNAKDAAATDNDILVSRSSDDGVSWSAPEILNTKADIVFPFGFEVLGGTPSPALATDGMGNWVASWRTTVPPDSNGDIDLLTSTSTDNGETWSDSVSVSTVGDAVIDASPRLVSTGEGEWLIMWNTVGFVIANSLKVSRSKDNGATWNAAETLIAYESDDPVRHNISRLETDGNGLWIGLGEFASHNLEEIVPVPTNDYDIFIMRSEDNGATWTDPVPLVKPSKKERRDDLIPILTTDRAGNWMAAWNSQVSTAKSGQDADLRVSFSKDDGVTWTTPVLLNKNGYSDGGADLIPAIRTDGLGNWLAVWSSENLLDNSNGSDVDTDIHFAKSRLTVGDNLFVISPNGGERIARGRKLKLEWLSIGEPGGQVALELLREGELVEVLKNNTGNDGKAKWRVPSDFQPGKKYKVRVKSNENPEINEQSDARFRVLE